MAVTDAKTGKPLATAKIGEGPDGAAWDAAHGLAFSPNGGSGTLTVIDASVPGYPAIEELPTQAGARTMDYDPAAALPLPEGSTGASSACPGWGIALSLRASAGPVRAGCAMP